MCLLTCQPREPTITKLTETLLQSASSLVVIFPTLSRLLCQLQRDMKALIYCSAWQNVVLGKSNLLFTVLSHYVL